MRLFVTGAGGGIGVAIARQAAAAGHEVLAHGRRAETLQPLADAGLPTVAGDITDTQHVRKLGEQLTGTGADAVIACHGVTGAISLSDLTREDVQRVLAVNTFSVFELAAATADALRQSAGTFVAIASQAALRAERENAIYCASKWALVQWGLGHSVRDYGYALRVLCPGRTDTAMLHEATQRIAQAQAREPAEYDAEQRASVPMGRYADPEEIAEAAIYLAAPSSVARPRVLAVTGGEVPY